MTPTCLLRTVVILVVMGTVTMVNGQAHSVCATDYYRDLPLNMQNEHQCLLMEQFNSEFFNDKEDRIRRYKELNIGLQDINYKLDQILTDLDPYYRDDRSESKKTNANQSPNSIDPRCTESKFKPNVDLVPFYKDCYDLLHAGNVSASGVYPLRMNNDDVVLGLCDMDRDGGGWTTIQRRVDGSVDFNRNWTEYKYGFGNPNSEYWLGLEYIHQISANHNTSLRVDVWDWDGKRVRAEYLVFYVAEEARNYTLIVSGYHGKTGDSLSYHNNCSFSTPERDNDEWPGHCARLDGAGWWYKGCSYAALNNKYHTKDAINSSQGFSGILWYHWKESYSYPLPKVEMKIRPAFL